MRKLSLKYNHGLTLIEVLITLVLISFSVIALIRFQSYLVYDNSVVQQKNDAIILATKQQETLRDFQVLHNTTGYTSYQSIASGSANIVNTTTTYSLAWTVTPFTNPTYKLIDIIVSWADRYNNYQSMRMITIVAGIDPSNSAVIM